MKILFYNFFFLAFFLIISRLIPHPPNFTPILATAILAPHVFSRKMYMSIILIILAMFISDLFIGLHTFLIFTYLPLVLIVFLSSIFKEFANESNYFDEIIIDDRAPIWNTKKIFKLATLLRNKNFYMRKINNYKFYYDK